MSSRAPPFSQIMLCSQRLRVCHKGACRCEARQESHMGEFGQRQQFHRASLNIRSNQEILCESGYIAHKSAVIFELTRHSGKGIAGRNARRVMFHLPSLPPCLFTAQLGTRKVICGGLESLYQDILGQCSHPQRPHKSITVPERRGDLCFRYATYLLRMNTGV